MTVLNLIATLLTSVAMRFSTVIATLLTNSLEITYFLITKQNFKNQIVMAAAGNLVATIVAHVARSGRLQIDAVILDKNRSTKIMT